MCFSNNVLLVKHVLEGTYLFRAFYDKGCDKSHLNESKKFKGEVNL